MKTFKLDRFGDIVISNNELVMVDGKEELKQAVWKRLSINLNEWFLDNDLGLNYDVFMNEKIYNRDLIVKSLEHCIMQEPRVAQAVITEVTLNKKTRFLEIVGYVTDKDESEIDISGVLRIE